VLFWGLASGWAACSKGTELPQLTLRDNRGQAVALHDYRGRRW
jgi:peroxiredoxin